MMEGVCIKSEHSCEDISVNEPLSDECVKDESLSSLCTPEDLLCLDACIKEDPPRSDTCIKGEPSDESTLSEAAAAAGRYADYVKDEPIEFCPVQVQPRRLRGDQGQTQQIEQNWLSNAYELAECTYMINKNITLICLVRNDSGTSATKLYRCGQCSFASTTKKSLQCHESTQHREKSYKCGKCSYASDLRRDLLAHERTHIDGKLFKCGQCIYAGASKRELLAHIVTHADKEFKCSQCGYASAVRRDILAHERAHADKKQFKRGHCSYATRYRRDCELISTGDIPDKCGQNSCASVQKSPVFTHEREHTGEKPYRMNTSHASVTKSSLIKNRSKGLTITRINGVTVLLVTDHNSGVSEG